jgi:hypothetical protein
MRTVLCFQTRFINKGRLIVRMKSLSHRERSSLVNKCRCLIKGFLLYHTRLDTFSQLFTYIALWNASWGDRYQAIQRHQVSQTVSLILFSPCLFVPSFIPNGTANMLQSLTNQFPPSPEYPIRAVSNFFENSGRYSQVKMHHRYQRHRWQICPRCQRHRRQFSKKFETDLMVYSGAWGKLIHEKTRCRKSRDTVSLSLLPGQVKHDRCQFPSMFMIFSNIHSLSANTFPVGHYSYTQRRSLALSSSALVPSCATPFSSSFLLWA